MLSPILVTYATRYGSTRDVAEAIAKRLRERGADVDVKPAKEVDSLDGCAAVVLGSGLYIGSLLKDAAGFLERHRASLERVPVAVFALGPISADEGLDEARGQLDAALAKSPWLKVASAETFVGAYDPARLRFADKLLAALPASPLHGVTAHDERDWDAIGAWADSLADTLR